MNTLYGFTGSFDEFLELFLEDQVVYGSYFANVLSWWKLRQVCMRERERERESERGKDTVMYGSYSANAVVVEAVAGMGVSEREREKEKVIQWCMAVFRECAVVVEAAVGVCVRKR